MSTHIVGLPVEPSIRFLPPSIGLRMLGDDMSLTTQEHHAADSSYRMRFASYIRGKGPDGVPVNFRTHMLAVRAFDAHGMMLSWELVEGAYLEEVIGRLLAEPKAQHLRVHYAALDRYAACVERN